MDKTLKATIIEAWGGGDHDESIKVIEDGEWIGDGIGDGKYSSKETIVEHEGVTYGISESRSGGYFSEYNYSEPKVYQVALEQVTITKWVAVH